jgi:hypothetical protein
MVAAEEPQGRSWSRLALPDRRLPDQEDGEMAGQKDDQAAKDEIAQGMAEAGKGEVKGGRGKAGKGQQGHGADPSKLTEGMAEAGSGVPSSDQESGTSGKR